MKIARLHAGGPPSLGFGDLQGKLAELEHEGRVEVGHYVVHVVLGRRLVVAGHDHAPVGLGDPGRVTAYLGHRLAGSG